jgi:hypothetical protein
LFYHFTYFEPIDTAAAAQDSRPAGNVGAFVGAFVGACTCIGTVTGNGTGTGFGIDFLFGFRLGRIMKKKASPMLGIEHKTIKNKQNTFIFRRLLLLIISLFQKMGQIILGNIETKNRTVSL